MEELDWRLVGQTLIGPTDRVRLSGQQAAVLAGLRAAWPETTAYDVLAALLWPDPDRMPEWSVTALRVHASHLRRALRAVGSQSAIVVHWREGYRLG